MPRRLPITTDGRAVRLAEASSRFGLGWDACVEEKVVPWTRIESITIHSSEEPP